MKISIVTPCFNSEKTIRDTISSVQAQKLNVEHVFVDGGSTDGTINVIRELMRPSDQLISEADDGIYDAMNKGIRRSSGSIVGIINSDDRFSNPGVLENVVKCFQDSIGIVYGGIRYISEDGTQLGDLWVPSEYRSGGFATGWHPPHPGLFVRKEVYNAIGLYDTAKRTAADFDWMLKAFELYKIKSRRWGFLVADMRLGGASDTWKGRLNGYREMRKSWIDVTGGVPSLYFLRRYSSKIGHRYFKGSRN